MIIEFNFDWASLWEKFLLFTGQNAALISWQLFIKGGWVIILGVFIYACYYVWLDARQGLYASKWKHVLLAIDIPKNNEQTPKAVENIFVALAGAQSNGNLLEIFWEGKVQESFSFEIVSLEGYIQFLVRTPVHFRDLIEAAIYAQYPEAEITEVEDYTKPLAGVKFPHEKYNLWGTEFMLVKDYPFPIKTYIDFEHSLSGNFLDPMAGVLEIMSHFSQGEQLWLQFIVTPLPPGWGEGAKKVVKELTGQGYEAPQSKLDEIILAPIKWIEAAFSFAISLIGLEAPEEKKKDADQFKMLNMSPGERTVLEMVQRKMTKPAFRLKFRMVYFGEKPVFAKGRGVAAVIGAIQQFNTSNSNGFKPGKVSKTGADYFSVSKRVAKKQNKIFHYYIKRNNYNGDPVGNMIFNPEELASLWHFPIMTVKAPLVEKISSKTVVPPTRLPLSERNFGQAKTEEPLKPPASKKPSIPFAPVGGQPIDLPNISEETVTATETVANQPEKPSTPPDIRPEPPANLPIV